MVFDRSQPHNDLPPLPPPAVESIAVLKKAISANAALAELRGRLGTIPDPSILVNAVVLQEAKDSSEIENVVTTNDELFRAEALSGRGADAQTKEVLNYRQAVWRAFDELQSTSQLNSELIVEVASDIKGESLDIRDQPGTVIAAGKRIVYTPPSGDAVIRKKLAELCKFIHRRDDLDDLVRLALIHYQFEAIHPFYDGNGRTGRVVNVLYLVLKGLLPLPVLYLSRFIIRTKNAYYKLLRDVTENGAWEPWILYILEGVEETSATTAELVAALRRLQDETAETIRAALPRIYSHELVELIFRQPYCRIGMLVDAGIAARKAAGLYLRELEDLGVLQSEAQGRDVLFINTRLCQLMRDLS